MNETVDEMDQYYEPDFSFMNELGTDKQVMTIHSILYTIHRLLCRVLPKMSHNDNYNYSEITQYFVISISHNLYLYEATKAHSSYIISIITLKASLH